jgi:hypothetical protein
MAISGAPGINFVQSNNLTVTGYATTATTGTVTTAYANWGAEWVDYGPVSSSKKITIEGMTIRIIKYSNYKIGINDLTSRFINDEKGTHVEFNVGSLVYFDTVDEAKGFLNKLRGQVKRMKAFAKECDIDSDFA